MLRRYAAPLGAVLCGVFGASLDWYNRANQNSLFLPLCALLVFGSALILFFSFTVPLQKDRLFEEHFAGDSTLLKLFSVLGGIILLLGSAASAALSIVLMNGFSFSVLAQFALGILGVVSGFCCILLAKAQAAQTMDAQTAFYTIILMVWSAFWLILVFKYNNTNPHWYNYLTNLFSGISLTLAFLFYCRFLYSTPAPRLFLSAACIAIFFCCTAAGSSALLTFFPGDSTGVPLSELLYAISALGGGIYLTGQVIRLCAPRRQVYYWQEND